MGAEKRLYADITATHPEVTGSCLLVSVRYSDGRHTNFIVDCGLFQERAYNHLNGMGFPFKSENVSFALVTHNHADHIGRLPMLTKSGFTGKIYMPRPTASLLPLAIGNSFAIMKEEYRRNSKKLLYNEEDIYAVYNQVEPCKYGETIYIDQNISITYFDNAHLIGAGMVLVQISEAGEENINILFTGDYKRTNIFKQVENLPEWVYKKPITIVTEATYGTTESSEIEVHFEQDVEKLISEGKSLLISATAQGRTQEVLYTLKKMQQEGKLNLGVQIGLDGKLAQKYTCMYRSSKLGIDPEKTDFLPRNFYWLTKNTREAFFANKKQKIIVCTSGMLDYGPAQMYLPAVIEKPNWVVYITCYCPETTLGYRLKNARDEKIQINGKEFNIKAQIYWTEEYSAHAKADEIEGLIRDFENPVLVLLNHGEKEVAKKFALRLEEDNVAHRVELLGEYTNRVVHQGCAKIISSKLHVESSTEGTRHSNVSKSSKGRKSRHSKYGGKRAYKSDKGKYRRRKA